MTTKLIPTQLAATLPALYALDGQGYDAPATAHLFMGGCDWYITEYSSEDNMAFGLACLNGDVECAELGYVSLDELEEYNTTALCPVELDLYWTPKTLAACREELERKYGTRRAS
jgi:hypothetical protein